MDLSAAVRRHPVVLLLGVVLAILSAGPAWAGTARAAPAPPAPVAPAPPLPAPPPGTPGLAPPNGPAAWALVDADTGNVIDAANDHTPMRPASISKILTAIIATQDLPPNAVVPVSPIAAGTESVKLGMRAGEVWSFNDTLHAMLMLSANDAATALAERVSGSLGAWVGEMQRMGTVLHLADHPVLHDPAGLDDQFSVVGGNYMSAYDLAIVARAALAIPQIRQIVALPQYQFVAPDGVVHQIKNVDRGPELYPGGLGIKTGYTKAAGNTYMAAASRDGRTMVAIVLQSPDIYRSAGDLLDLGFATPVARESRADHLPGVPSSLAAAPTTTATTTPSAAAPSTRGLAVTSPHGTASFDGLLRDIVLGVAAALLVLGTVTIVLRRRAVRRRRARFGSWGARHSQ